MDKKRDRDQRPIYLRTQSSHTCHSLKFRSVRPGDMSHPVPSVRSPLPCLVSIGIHTHAILPTVPARPSPNYRHTHIFQSNHCARGVRHTRRVGTAGATTGIYRYAQFSSPMPKLPSNASRHDRASSDYQGTGWCGSSDNVSRL